MVFTGEPCTDVIIAPPALYIIPLLEHVKKVNYF